MGVKHVKTEVDKFKGVTVTRHKKELSSGMLSGLMGNTYTYRLRHLKNNNGEGEYFLLDCTVKAKDWFFSHEGDVTFLIDGTPTQVSFVETDSETQHIGDKLYCFETGYFELTEEQFRAICDSSSLEMRITGARSYEEPTAGFCVKLRDYFRQFSDGVFKESKYEAKPEPKPKKEPKPSKSKPEKKSAEIESGLDGADSNAQSRKIPPMVWVVIAVLLIIILYMIIGSNNNSESGVENSDVTQDMVEEQERSSSVEDNYAEDEEWIPEAEPMSVEPILGSLDEVLVLRGRYEASDVLDDDHIRYGIDNIHDYDATTTFAVSMSDIRNGYFSINYRPENRTLAGVRILNGYCKTGALWEMNARAKSITIRTENYEIMTTLVDTPNWQYIQFPVDIEGDVYSVSISDIYEGTTYDDLCISEFEFVDEIRGEPGSVNEEVALFLEEYTKSLNRAVADIQLLGFYESRVDYYDWGLVEKSRIQADKKGFFDKWDVVNYEIMEPVKVVEHRGEKTYVEVVYRSKYYALSTKSGKESKGISEVLLHLHLHDYGYAIAKEKSKVIERY